MSRRLSAVEQWVAQVGFKASQPYKPAPGMETMTHRQRNIHAFIRRKDSKAVHPGDKSCPFYFEMTGTSAKMIAMDRPVKKKTLDLSQWVPFVDAQ